MCERELWPVIVISDRYMGTYSGAQWTAFNTYDVPNGPADSDTECCDFWQCPNMPVGKGGTPDETVVDLEVNVEQWKIKPTSTNE